MTGDEMIEAAAKAIKGSIAYSSFWPNSDYEIMAQAAIRVIAPAVLEEAAEQFEKSQMSWRWGTVVAQDLRALKTRYEQ